MADGASASSSAAEAVAALGKLKSYLDYGTFQPIQIASIIALNEEDEYVTEVNEIYRRRRDTLMEGLDRAGWKVEPPKGTMFVWAPIPDPYAHMGSLEFSFHLLEHAKVAVSPGIGFGDAGEGFVRFAPVENEHRIGQATRNIRRSATSERRHGLPTEPPTSARHRHPPDRGDAPGDGRARWATRLRRRPDRQRPRGGGRGGGRKEVVFVPLTMGNQLAVMAQT